MAWDKSKVYQHPQDYEERIAELEARLKRANAFFKQWALWLEEKGYTAASRIVTREADDTVKENS